MILYFTFAALPLLAVTLCTITLTTIIQSLFKLYTVIGHQNRKNCNCGKFPTSNMTTSGHLVIFGHLKWASAAVC